MQKIKNFFSIISKGITYLTANFKGILLALFILFLLSPSDEKVQPPNVVQIDLTGAIYQADKIVEKIEEAKESSTIKGVLFVISSPGGAVAPSIEIAYAIKRLSAVKPIVTYAQGTMASGSYYASIWSHKIIANPGALVGSIGVIFQGYNLEEVMKTLGVSTQTAKIGKFKEIGTPTRAWHSYEKKELEKVIQDTYDLFVSDVAKARHLKIEDHQTFADAHIFSAAEALKVGLIDEVATIYEAKQALKGLTGLSKLFWKKQNFAEKFAQRLTGDVLSTIESHFLNPVLK